MFRLVSFVFALVSIGASTAIAQSGGAPGPVNAPAIVPQKWGCHTLAACRTRAEPLSRNAVFLPERLHSLACGSANWATARD